MDRALETSTLKERINVLDEKLEIANATAQSFEKEVRQLKQEENHLKDKYLSELKQFEEGDLRCRTAEMTAKKATELADNARAEAASALKEKNEIQRVAIERLAQIERAERLVENLERDKARMMDKIRILETSERDAISKVALLEERVDEREREMGLMLNKSNEHRSDTVQMLEGLLATERTALSEANERAESLSVQLQTTQRKLDVVHQELASVRLNETALDSRLRASSHGKRSRMDVDSMQDMEVDRVSKGRRKSKSTTSPFKLVPTEDGGSVYGGDDDDGKSQSSARDSEDYTKFTVSKLKQELTKNGFGAELLELKSPNKKDIVFLYEKHVLKK